MLRRKYLRIAAYVIIICIILFLVLVYLLDGRSISFFSIERGVCMTHACLVVNNVLQKYVDNSVNPCDDFAKFACNTYVKDMKKKNQFGSGLLDSTKEGKDLYYRSIRKPYSFGDSEMTRFAKLYYASCMNKEFLKNQELTAVYEQLDQMKIWPLLNSITPYHSWTHVAQELHLTGLQIYPIVRTEMTIEHDEICVFILKGTPITFSSHDEKENIKYVKGLFKANHILVPPQLKELLGDAHKVGRQIAEILKGSSKQKPEIWKTISELKRECPDLNWSNIVNIPVTDKHRKVNGNEKVLMSDVDVICNLASILNNSDRRAIINYLFLVTVHIFKTNFRGMLYFANITDENHKRSIACADLVLNTFPFGASFVFMDQRDSDLGAGYRKDMNNMFNIDVKSEVKRMIEHHNKWINKYARTKLVEKINKIRFHMGMIDPQDSLDKGHNDFWEIFKKAHLTGENLLRDMIKVHYIPLHYVGKQRKLNFMNQLLIYPKMADVINANAWYINNQIILTYALATPLTYKYMGPKFHNLGAVGHIGGHEFGHSLDAGNYKTDVHLKPREDMWSKTSDEKYKEKLKCLETEYSKLYDPCSESYINGTLTLRENTADITGLLVARRLYENYIKGRSSDVRLPNFKFYSSKQMFWMSSALVLCEHSSKETCVNWNKIDPHTRGPLRINQNVKFSPYFAYDFHCPLGSPMNPEKKCVLFEYPNL